MTFDEWWEEFTSIHPEWQYADHEALRRQAFAAGAASRDAEIAELNDALGYDWDMYKASQEALFECMKMVSATPEQSFQRPTNITECLEKPAKPAKDGKPQGAS